jgi:hypothetical protein
MAGGAFFDLTDVLIGKLDEDFEPRFTAMARIPAPLAHGTPAVGTQT